MLLPFLRLVPCDKSQRIHSITCHVSSGLLDLQLNSPIAAHVPCKGEEYWVAEDKLCACNLRPHTAAVICNVQVTS